MGEGEGEQSFTISLKGGTRHLSLGNVRGHSPSQEGGGSTSTTLMMVLRELILHPNLPGENGSDMPKCQNHQILLILQVQVASPSCFRGGDGGIIFRLRRWSWHPISNKKVEVGLDLF